MTSIRKAKARADGEGSIYFSESKQLWVATTRHEGKTIEKSAKLRKDAIKKRDEWLKQRDAGLNVKADKWLLGDWLDYALERKTPRYDKAGNRTEGIEPTTLEKYETVARLHIKPFLGTAQLSIKSLSPERLERWQRDLEDKGRTAGMRREALMWLSQALDLAVRRRLLPYNPADNKQIERPRVATRKHVQPSEADLAKLLRAIADDPLELLAWIGLGTGLRRAEVAGLWWEDVTYPTKDTAIIRTHQRVNRLGRRMTQRLGRTSSRLEREGLKSQPERIVHVAGLVRAVLDRHYNHQLAQRMAAGPAWRGADYHARGRTGFIFTSSIGTPIEPDKISKYFTEIRERAELDINRFHALRRALSTLLDKAGVSDRVSMQILGHANVEMTHYYNTPMDSQLAAAAQAVNGELQRLLALADA